ncbi:hypothetical protein FGSG_05383 [Fusarium graminearum PH-1]|uniref:hypothetical protein n=1 Tax=Gibberella zeae (strain ATCC MYA-4620 / CBS 123657 / FGSC 9075 / NRRL 31084 / PH-1) TaxID=229533 RepID=UPI000023F280|nr:hypothetical protein FGSG_05383 [Fusarium graminearum PH-1]ESU11333.1 hypothetical protein FGSG_05383 [Fusarium graminearum PH-1]|eukprot:XP_011323909.1 hypothetical protein FGSG_05383 [Fusarium graminearum PH-1]
MATPGQPSSNGRDTEPFPSLDNASPTNADTDSSNIHNRPAASSSLSGHLRRVSQSFEVSGPPEGFMAATGTIASSIFSRQTVTRRTSESSIPMQTGQSFGNPSRQNTFPTVNEEAPAEKATASEASPRRNFTGEPAAAAPFDNGYHFPPKHSAGQSTKLGLIAFGHYVLTPTGFLVTLYGLNVVAWGGMLFLLLCLLAMLHRQCFGLAPWRFRDLYFLLQYRVQKKEVALRRLAGIHRGWFRLPGSDQLDPQIGPHNISSSPHLSSSLACPFPPDKIPDAPLTGVRAPPTAITRMDAVVWLMVWNTFLQCVLSGFMWGLNRYDRPSWSTGLFVALACIVAAIGGIVMFIEGKKVKGIEGVPISLEDQKMLQEDRERGVWHYNNIKDKDLAAEEAKKKKTDKK